MNTDIESGCILPLAQSLISGIVTAVLAYSLALYFEWERAPYIALLGGAVGLAGWWWREVMSWRRRVYPDETPLPPERPTPRVEVQVKSEDQKHIQLAELPVSAEQLAQLARGLLDGQTLSEGAWCGAGRPFSKSEFHQVRQEFIKRGWATWRNSRAPAQGVDLSAAGRAVMRTFASETALPYREVRHSKKL